MEDIKSIYNGPEMTGNLELDSRLTELRKQRDFHTEESCKCQKEIDSIILDSVCPDIKCGDWYRFDTNDDRHRIFRVENVHRISSGISIQPSVFLTTYEDSENFRLRDMFIDSDPEQIYVFTDQLKSGYLKKSSRKEFLSESRRICDEIVRLSENVVDDNQLELDLQDI